MRDLTQPSLSAPDFAPICSGTYSDLLGSLARLITPNSSFLLLVVRMLLVAMPGAPSSVLAPSSRARSP